MLKFSRKDIIINILQPRNETMLFLSLCTPRISREVIE